MKAEFMGMILKQNNSQDSESSELPRSKEYRQIKSNVTSMLCLLLSRERYFAPRIFAIKTN